MFQNLRDWVHAFFHREVDSILAPLQTAIRRVDAFGAKLRGEIVAAERRLSWAKDEHDKAARVGAKLKELVG